MKTPIRPILRPIPSTAFAVLIAAVSPRAVVAQTPGETLYVQNCSACHQPTGKGVPGAFPALADDPIALGPADRLAALILKGRGGMPSFRNDLNDDQISAALTYVRAAWGNHAPEIAPAVIKTARGAGAAPASSQALQAH